MLTSVYSYRDDLYRVCKTITYLARIIFTIFGTFRPYGDILSPLLLQFTFILCLLSFSDPRPFCVLCNTFTVPYLSGLGWLGWAGLGWVAGHLLNKATVSVTISRCSLSLHAAWGHCAHQQPAKAAPGMCV